MDAQDEMIIKKKRTKRIRLGSPLSLMMTSSSCNTGGGVGSGDINCAAASPSRSGGLVRGMREEEEEEEDMANCLILLAHGRDKKLTEETILDSYQCKTCNRCFPSFQALGGHRASHKKPKALTKEDIKQPMGSIKEQEIVELNEETTILSLQISSSRAPCNPSNNKRVHECSICGAEFNSGQALGGHMRRHRPIPVVNSNNQEECYQESKKPRVLLSLDLNLPAPPEDDHHLESQFSFAGKEQVIVFSASPLVHCHY